MRNAFVLLLAVVFVLIGEGHCKIINFDDLAFTIGEPAPIPDGYFGLDWDSNWRCFNYDSLPGIEPSSSPNAAGFDSDGWNVLQAEASISFLSINADPFEGGYLAGDNDVEVYFAGWFGSTLVGTSKTITLTATPTFLAADFSGQVDKIVVYAERKYTTSTFVIDDIVYIPCIPEPATVSLFILGGLALRRRR